MGAMRLLEAVRTAGVECRYYQASSSEMFGATPPPQNEETPFYPRSPYGAAKVYAYWMTRNYREAYGMFAVNGILFNHESPRRGETFVTRKITRAVARIKAGLENTVYLGNLDAIRDWGYAPEYVEGMWRMLQADEPTDFALATGGSYTVRDFVQAAFEQAGLDWEKHVQFDERYLRPTEVDALIGDASKAERLLGWKAHGRHRRAGPDHGRRGHRGTQARGQPLGSTRSRCPAGRPASSDERPRLHSGTVGPIRDGLRGWTSVGWWDRLSGGAWRRKGFTGLIGRSHAELDLTDRAAVFTYFAREPARVRRARGGQGRRDHGEQHLPGELPHREPPDPAQRHGCGARAAGGAAALPGLLVHLPQVRPTADPRGLAAHRPPRTDQRRVRHRQDRRDHAGAGGAAAASGCHGSRRCRPTSTGPTTTSRRRDRTSSRH